MILDKKTRELIEMCNYNIKSFSKEEEILKYLPIENEKFKILFVENKLVFDYNSKTSYVYLEKNYFSNIEIMRRIGIILGIVLDKEDIFSVTKFCLKIKQALNEGDL